ncbi:MAG: hypothetical protein QNK24_09030, partial [Desulfuromusa sp.]|nr:hypothetical protein [Desulfuromusa sp.]
WLIAHLRYRTFVLRESGSISAFLLAGWQFDAFYDRLLIRPFRGLCRFCWQGVEVGLVDGLIEGFARTCVSWGQSLRKMTNGQISSYLQGFIWGLLLIIGWFLLRAVA